MGSANHASAWDVGYFPPCAVAATCGIGILPRAASRVSMPVQCTAHLTVQAVQGLRRESRRRWRRRGPEEHVHPRVEHLLRRLHTRTLESRPPASQPVGNYLLFQSVPSRVRTSQPRRMLPPVACQNNTAGHRGRPAPRERFEETKSGHGACAPRDCELRPISQHSLRSSLICMTGSRERPGLLSARRGEHSGPEYAASTGFRTFPTAPAESRPDKRVAGGLSAHRCLRRKLDAALELGTDDASPNQSAFRSHR